MSNTIYGFIGAGNMGTAIIEGLLEYHHVSPANILVSDPNSKTRSKMQNKGIKTVPDNTALVKSAGMIFIAVKPYLVNDVLKEIEPLIDDSKTIISIAAGLTLKDFSMLAQKNVPYCIAIPNTAISKGQSFTAISSETPDNEKIKQVEELFNKMGTCVFMSDQHIGAATVAASCGIAFALRFIRAITSGGVEAGLKPELAQEIGAQICKGAAEIMQNSNSNPEHEIDKVTTPKGITITGLNEMENHGFSAAVMQGIMKAYKKIEP